MDHPLSRTPSPNQALDEASAGIRCPACKASYDTVLAGGRANSVTVKCEACSHVFSVAPPLTERRSSAAVWTVRKSDGERIPLPSLRSLQQRVQQGEFTESAEFARADGSWKRLDAMEELRPSFAARDSNAALTTAASSVPLRPWRRRWVIMAAATTAMLAVMATLRLNSFSGRKDRRPPSAVNARGVSAPAAPPQVASPAAVAPTEAPIGKTNVLSNLDTKAAYLAELRAGRRLLESEPPKATELAAAKAHFEAALHHRPGGSEAIAGLGLVAARRGLHDEAVWRLRKAAKAGFSDAAFELGELHRARGEQALASAAYRLYLERRPQGSHANEALARLTQPRSRR